MAVERMTTDLILKMIQGYTKGLKYLEIGVYRGATLANASEVSSLAVGIDDFSQFDAEGFNEKATYEKIKAFDNCELIKGDCYKRSTINKAKKLGPFDVFFYDGNHGEKQTFEAIKKYHSLMADSYILIIDDWNLEDVQKATDLALGSLKAESKIIEKHLTEKNASKDYWNGIAVFEVIKK